MKASSSKNRPPWNYTVVNSWEKGLRFHQSSVYLVGHSWGSILGLRFVRAYPELVHTYIGCGQVVNMKKSSKSAYEYALAHADKKDLEKLRRIDCSYQTDSWLNDLLFVTRQVVKHKGSLYGRTNYNNLVRLNAIR